MSLFKKEQDPRVTAAGSAVAIGSDAAVVANRHIVMGRPDLGRSGEVIDELTAGPTLGGLDGLAKRLAKLPGAMAVAEPTSMTWLPPLNVALGQTGIDQALVGNRHSARLRSVVAGKNKSDPIDADVLSRAGEFFEFRPVPTADELALRRAVQRQAKSSSTPTGVCSGSSPSLAGPSPMWGMPDQGHVRPGYLR